MIAVIDYGVGNLFSLVSSLRFLGLEAEVTSDAAQIERAERIILPGVGAFGDAMEKLSRTGLVPVVRAQAGQGKPLLGICLGMQMLFEKSYEYGEHAGLGLIPGSVFPMEPDLHALGFSYKVPQIGWNSLDIRQPASPILRYTRAGEYVYYVHSFYAKHCDPYIAASSDYGVAVPGVVARGNVYGCQFHPEKSGSVGLAILRAFSQIEPEGTSL